MGGASGSGFFLFFLYSYITANYFLFVSLSDCSFQDFVRGELQMLRSHPRPDSTSHHITAGSHTYNIQLCNSVLSVRSM